ncbi:hypothetical protein NDU88_001317 [Pleurodeles waltl]|uniref:Uncharacterized protein n=1 Tax=Pleurodeles waltl TaxID=8319 RepID=A0AAV7MJD2_PLEWA|nr:hypothetical protein NDU88_001317 [Pleurodeles waltl]
MVAFNPSPPGPSAPISGRPDSCREQRRRGGLQPGWQARVTCERSRAQRRRGALPEGKEQHGGATPGDRQEGFLSLLQQPLQLRKA